MLQAVKDVIPFKYERPGISLSLSFLTTNQIPWQQTSAWILRTAIRLLDWLRQKLQQIIPVHRFMTKQQLDL
jgi:hypothetical protein